MALTLLAARAHVVRSSNLAIAALPARSVVVAGGQSIAPAAARYFAEITERIGSTNGPIAAQFSAANRTEIPMKAEPFTSDVYPSNHRVVIIRDISENLGASSTVSSAAPATVATATGLALDEPSPPRATPIGATPASSGLASPFQGGNLVTGTTYAVPLPIVATLLPARKCHLSSSDSSISLANFLVIACGMCERMIRVMYHRCNVGSS